MTTRPKLKTRLMLSFTITAVLAIGITGWQAYDRAREALEQETFNRLTAVREARKQQVEFYVTRLSTDVIGSSNDQRVVEAAGNLLRAATSCPLFSRPPAVAARLIDSLLSDAAPNGAGLCAPYIRAYRGCRTILQEHLSLLGYEDALIADAESGRVLFSVRRRADFCDNLLTGRASQGNAGEAFRAVRGTTDRNAVRLVDFQRSPDGGTIAAFVSSPIAVDGRTVAVLLFRVSISAINSLMTEDNTWEENGLGHSGETYIVGGDYRMRSDSRFFIQEPAKYFAMLRGIGTSAGTVEAIRRSGSSVLLQEVHTDAVHDALDGRTDTRIVQDYRGVPVLSSFTPLQIAGVRWVLLSEIDAGEAFHAVYRLREHLILIGCIILLGTLVAGYATSRFIARPILDLADSTRRFGSGEMRQRVRVTSHDEIGLLGDTFNTMADRIMHDTEALREEIAERQRAEEEVRVSREQYRRLSAHLQTVREEERGSIAREIHDELGQNLTVLKLELSLLRQDAGESETVRRITGMERHIDSTIAAVKRIITELRPGILDDLGLSAAIEWQAEEFQNRTGITCTVDIEPPDIVADRDRSTAVFRILQEALTNVLRHAAARRVRIAVTRSDAALTLSVEDDGRGITPEERGNPQSFGLIGIRERAHAWGGSVTIEGTPGAGTRVYVNIPTTEAREHHDLDPAG